jgi:NADP-dependent 3-hydroxy acid dehydrogenase YdfG
MGGKDSCALIAGVSSGMGCRHARLFAKDGKDIVALARSRDILEGLKTE